MKNTTYNVNSDNSCTMNISTQSMKRTELRSLSLSKGRSKRHSKGRKHLTLNSSLLTVFAVLLCIFFGGKAWGQMTATFNDGTTTMYYVPFYGYYADFGAKGQFIIPATELANKGITSGCTISKLTFNSSGTTSGTFFGASCIVELGEVQNTTFGSAAFVTSGLTTVFSGTSLTITNGTMEVSLINYNYNGGNLLISIGGYGTGCPSTSWYGVSSTNAGVYGYNNSNSQTIPSSASGITSYAPKTTITYMPTTPSIILSPSSATILTGSTQTLTATRYNVTGTPTISYTSSNTSVATVSGSGTTATVTGVSEGSATITASMTYSGRTYTATSSITVIDACKPTWSGSSNYYISNFTVSSSGTILLNNSSTGTARTTTNYYSTKSITAEPGDELSCTITMSGSSGTYGFALWVDFDKDGLEADDYMFKTSSYQSTPYTGTFTIPANTPAGEYRLRIFGDFNSSAPSNPCGAYSNGEAEDYKLIVTVPTCPRPTNLTVSNITATGATLSWTESGSATNWVLEYADNSSFTGATSVNVNGTPTKNLTGLTPETTYYARVKSNCGGGDVSDWSAICEFTPSNCHALGTGTSTTNTFPTYVRDKYSLTQQIYTASEIGGEGTINQISFYYGSTSLSTARSIVVYLKHTSKNAFSNTNDWETISTTTDKVFDGTLSCEAKQWYTITLDEPFEYNGTNNLLLCVDDNTGSFASDTRDFYSYSTGSNRSIYVHSDATNYDVSSPSAGTLSTSNSQIKFCITPSTPPTHTITATANPAEGGTVTFMAGPANSNAASTHLPLDSYRDNSFSQQIYTPEEIGGGSINGISLFSVNGTNNHGIDYTRTLDVYLAHTDKTEFSSRTDWISNSDSPDMVKVYSGSVTFNCGEWNTINFTTPFNYDGVRNLVLTISDKSGYSESTEGFLDCKTFTPSSGGNCSLNFGFAEFNPSGSSNNGELLTVKNQILVNGSSTRTFPQGASCTLVATANANYHFDNYTEGSTELSTNEVYTVSNITADHNIVGNFSLPTFTLTTSVNPTGGGTITCSPSSANGVYTYGTVVTLTANAATGYTFQNWTVDGVTVSGSPTSVTMTADHNVVANFTINTYTVTYNANGGSGTMSSTSGQYNTSIPLSANGFTAPAGKMFDSWNTNYSGTGTRYTAGQSYTITGNITLYAQWVNIPRSVSISSASAVCSGQGTTLTATATGFTNPQYTWSASPSEGAGLPDNVHTSTITVTPDAGNYTYTCEVTEEGESAPSYSIGDAVYVNQSTLELVSTSGSGITQGKVMRVSGNTITALFAVSGGQVCGASTAPTGATSTSGITNTNYIRGLNPTGGLFSNMLSNWYSYANGFYVPSISELDEYVSNSNISNLNASFSTFASASGTNYSFYVYNSGTRTTSIVATHTVCKDFIVSSGVSGSVTVNVFQAPSVSFSPSTISECSSPVSISADLSGTDCNSFYQWTGGSETNTYSYLSVNESGTYYLTVTNRYYQQYDMITQNGISAIVVVAPTMTTDGKAVPILDNTISPNTGDGTVSYNAYEYLQEAIKVNGGNTYSSGSRNAFKIPAGAAGGVCQSTASVSVTINTPDITGDYDYIWKSGTSTDWNTASNWYMYSGGNYSVASSIPATAKNYFIGTGTCLPTDQWPSLSADATVGNVTIAGGSVTIPANKTLSIAGSVNGTLTAQDNSTIEFVGSSDQTIGTSQIFSNVNFNKGGANVITATGGLTINGEATFTKGIVNGNVTFGSSASITGTGANTSSYVDGLVTKSGSAKDFPFPTGDNRNLGIVKPTSTVSDVSVQYFSNPSGFGLEDLPRWWNVADMCGENPFNHVSNVEYWKISSPEMTADFTAAASSDMHFNGQTDTRDANDIQMAFFGSNCWNNVGGEAVINGSTITVTGATIPGSTRAISGNYITLGSKDHETLLPIELTSFTATCDGRSALIEWTTATEKNNDYFSLERSDDAINFTEIARVAGAGNSIAPIDYAYTDYGIHGGDNYYRLVQVDYDGTRTVSEIIVANCIEPKVGEPDVQAYPNPFNGELTLELDNFGNRPARIEVYDMLGKLIYTEKVAAPQNYYETILNLSNLPPAAYTVRVSTNDFVINRNVVKQ